MHTPPRSSPQPSPSKQDSSYPPVLRPVDRKHSDPSPTLPPPRRAAPSPLSSLHASSSPHPMQPQPQQRSRPMLPPTSRSSAVMQTLPHFQHRPPPRPSSPTSRLNVDPPPTLYPPPLRVAISPLVHDRSNPSNSAHQLPPVSRSSANSHQPPPPSRIPPSSHLPYHRPLQHDNQLRPLSRSAHFSQHPPLEVYSHPHARPPQPFEPAPRPHQTHQTHHSIQTAPLVDRSASPVLLPLLNNPRNSHSSQQPSARRLHPPSNDATEDQRQQAQTKSRIDQASARVQHQTPTRPPQSSLDQQQQKDQTHEQQAQHQQRSQQQHTQSQQQQQKQPTQPPLPRLPPPESQLPPRTAHSHIPIRLPRAEPMSSSRPPPQQSSTLDSHVKQPQQSTHSSQPPIHPTARSMGHDSYAQPTQVPLHYSHSKQHWHPQTHNLRHLPSAPHQRPQSHLLSANPVSDHPAYHTEPHWHSHHPHAGTPYDRQPPPRTSQSQSGPAPEPDAVQQNNWPSVRFPPPPPRSPPRLPRRLPHQEQDIRMQRDHQLAEAQPFSYQQRQEPVPLVSQADSQQRIINTTDATGGSAVNVHSHSQPPAPPHPQTTSTSNQQLPQVHETAANISLRVPIVASNQTIQHVGEISPPTAPSTPPPAQHNSAQQSAGPVGAAVDSQKRAAFREHEAPLQSLSAPRQLGAEEDMETPRPELKVEDALAYLEKVKGQFSGQQLVYCEFLSIMKEFKAQEIDTTQVIRGVSDLFRGHKELILGFNRFLPPGYYIRVTEGTSGVLKTGFDSPSGFSELPAARKVTSKNSNSRSNSKKRQIVGASAIAQAAADALSPKRTDSKKPLHISSSTQGPAVTTPQFPHQGSAHPQHPEETATLPLDHSDRQSLSTNQKHATPASRQQTAPRRAPPKHSSADDDTQPHQGPSMPRPRGKEENHRAEEFGRAIGFVNSVKERFADSPKTYSEFLETLSRFRLEQATIREVFETVASLFGPHKDLLAQFKEFLPSVAITGSSDSKPGRNRTGSHPGRFGPTGKSIAHSTPTRRRDMANGISKSRQRARDMRFFDELKNRLGSSKYHLYIEFIKCLSLFSQKIVSRDELQHLTSEILRDDPDAYSSFLEYLDQMATGSGSAFVDETLSSSMSFEDEASPIDQERLQFFKSHSMTEIAIEHGVEMLGSYRRIPPDCPALDFSGRSLHERRTINDTWINVTRGSEDYSFKFMRKNQSEDNLFRCEDDRYELDLVIETNAATIMKLQTIEATISTLQEGDKKRHALAPNALSPIHFNAIQRIYGESGLEVISQVKLNPFLAVPVVLKRLKEKDISWRRARMEMNKVWREVGERNFHRSLDHRSPSFKTVDKKDLSVKCLLSDILEPAVSLAAREAEVTRTRGYSVENGGGGSNHRSQALEAVAIAAKKSPDAPRLLGLQFIEARIHGVVFDVLSHVVEEEAGKRHIAAFHELVGVIFDIEFDNHGKCRAANGKARENVPFLYGDECVYVMMRLYHFVYERIMIALSLAHERVADREWREKKNVEGEAFLSGNMSSTSEHKPWHITKALNGGEIDAKFKLGPETETADEIFEIFVGHAKVFAKGKLEWSKFEDKLRVLLGVDSYGLFTIDKAVQKLVKAIDHTYGKDSNSRGFCEMFLKAHELLSHHQSKKGRLDGNGCNVIQSVAVCRHIIETRNPGMNVFRFRMMSEKKDTTSDTFEIGVVGCTSSEEGMKSRKTEVELRDEFLGFCSSFGDCKLHQELHNGAETVKESDAGAGASKKRSRSGEEEQGKPKKRKVQGGPDFLRFVGNAEQSVKRLRGSSIVIENDLRWTLSKKGKMDFKRGTSDFLINTSKKFYGNEELDHEEMNERSARVQKMRKKLKFGKNSERVSEGGKKEELSKEVDEVGEADIVKKDVMKVDVVVVGDEESKEKGIRKAAEGAKADSALDVSSSNMGGVQTEEPRSEAS